MLYSCSTRFVLNVLVSGKKERSPLMLMAASFVSVSDMSASLASASLRFTDAARQKLEQNNMKYYTAKKCFSTGYLRVLLK